MKDGYLKKWQEELLIVINYLIILFIGSLADFNIEKLPQFMLLVAVLSGIFILNCWIIHTYGRP